MQSKDFRKSVKGVKKRKKRSKESHLFKEVVSLLDYLLERRQIGLVIMFLGGGIMFFPYEFISLVPLLITVNPPSFHNMIFGFVIAIFGSFVGVSD